MINKTLSSLQLRTDKQNTIFILKNSVNNLDLAINNLMNPILKISEDARIYIRFSQRVAIENAFSIRTIHLKSLLSELKKELSQNDEIIFSRLNMIRLKIEKLRNSYAKSEMVFGYYVDLLHTRGIEPDIGAILKGYDVLSNETLKIFLSSFGHEIPTVIVYLEQIGDGAAILRADLSLWDRLKNPCAVIKLPQSSLNTPRSSIFHEVGHQIGSITGLNREGADLLSNTIKGSGGSTELAKYWKFCSTEIIADQFATQLTNWIGGITLFNIYAGSGSTLGLHGRMFNVIPNDTHLMGYLRVKCNLESCRQAFGDGPWNQMERVLDILYPISLAPHYSKKIIQESLPVIPNICKALSLTKLSSFGGKSFENIFSMNFCSPKMIRKLLNLNLTNFSIDMYTKIQNPIQTIVAFGILQMLGKKSLYWISQEMGKWLSALGAKELK